MSNVLFSKEPIELIHQTEHEELQHFDQYFPKCSFTLKNPEDVLHALKVIGSIKPQERISTHAGIFIQCPFVPTQGWWDYCKQWFQPVWLMRTKHNEDRNSNVRILRYVLLLAFQNIQSALRERQQMFQSLLNSFTSSEALRLERLSSSSSPPTWKIQPAFDSSSFSSDVMSDTSHNSNSPLLCSPSRSPDMSSSPPAPTPPPAPPLPPPPPPNFISKQLPSPHLSPTIVPTHSHSHSPTLSIPPPSLLSPTPLNIQFFQNLQFITRHEDALQSAIVGMGNLKQTYIDDANICARIETLQEFIRHRLLIVHAYMAYLTLPEFSPSRMSHDHTLDVCPPSPPSIEKCMTL